MTPNPEQALAAFVDEWIRGCGPVVVHTSGSTGTPKKIALDRGDMRRSALATCERFGITAASTVGMAISAAYIGGRMMVLRALVSGADFVQLPVSNRLRLDRRVDLLSIVPSQVPSLLDDIDPALVGAVLVGGAPLSPALERRLADSGIEAYATYGMTETASHVALRRIGDPEGVYEAMPGITFATDARGCLTVVSEEASWQSLQTNDLVCMVDPRRFVWLGRHDNIINSGGVKLVPEQLELRLQTVIDRPYCIRGAADDKWGQTVELVVEGTPAEVEALRPAVETVLTGAERPRRYTAVEALPRTANGKLRR